MKKIPYAKQTISQDDIDAVTSVLKADFLTQGPVVPEFEQRVASYANAVHAVAVNSATSALHIACLALGVGPGDQVWTSAITFVASANCALYCGATVDFVDIDPKTYNVSVEHLTEKLAIATKTGKLPKIVIVVHFAGQPCDLEGIHSLSKKYGFKIIEDASHALGARYKGLPIGDCRYSDVTVFSFHPVKIITTAEGGMALTNNPNTARRMQLLRSHGITALQTEMSVRPPNEIWNYQQIELGFNYRMTDLHAALGLSQLQRVDEFVEKRRQLAERYDQVFTKHPLITPWQHPDSYSAFHLYVLCMGSNYLTRSRAAIFKYLHDREIYVNLHYIPVYLQPFYQSLGFLAGHCPEAEAYFARAITLPLYPNLSDVEQERVIETICEAIET